MIAAKRCTVTKRETNRNHVTSRRCTAIHRIRIFLCSHAANSVFILRIAITVCVCVFICLRSEETKTPTNKKSKQIDKVSQ